MKIDRILYDGDEKGYQLSIRETRQIVDLLENDPRFDKFVIELRRKLNIPKNGCPFKEYVNKGKYSINEFFDDEGDSLFEPSIEFVNDLGLPFYWWSSIAYFVMYNIFFTPERYPTHAYYEPDDYRLRRGVHIVIKEKLSKNELKKYIDEDWESISEQMGSFPKVIKGHNLRRSNLAKEIHDMRVNKKMKYKDIADELFKKHESSSFVDIINEDYVKMLYHRWDKIVNRFRKT